MMDWDDSGSSSDDDAEDVWHVPKAVNRMTDTAPGTSRGSMRGLQLAIQEGWLVQRARDMCSFTHDRFRQAAQAEAAGLPETTVAKMSFRVCLQRIKAHSFLVSESDTHRCCATDNSYDAPRKPRYLPHCGTC